MQPAWGAKKLMHKNRVPIEKQSRNSLHFVEHEVYYHIHDSEES
jgi:hypothetical protein